MVITRGRGAANMNGCLRPSLERHRSEMEPINGSVIASEAMPIVTAAAVIVPEDLVVEEERQGVEYPIGCCLAGCADAKSDFDWHRYCIVTHRVPPRDADSALIYSGPIPQQPPMIAAPASSNRLAYSRKNATSISVRKPV